MAARYNRGGSSSMYRYNEPTISQYESFFNPIPLEFLQGIAEKDQQRYDVGYGEALAAADMYGGAEVSETDIANKNKIVGEFTNNMDRMVKEKYGGDWGRASKEVARMVTNVRQNPFWDTAKILKQRQDEERKVTAQYGNDTLIFKSLMNQSSIDPTTGKVISPDQLQYDIRKRGDWAGSIDEILSKIKPDTNVWGLSKADFGYLRSGKTTQISEEGINKIAKDKSVQKAILSANPDMAEAFEKLPGERSKWFGDNYSDLGTAVEELIKGRGKSMVFKQQDDQYLRDILGEEARANAAKNVTPTTAFGPPREMAAYDTGYGTTDEQKRVAKTFLFDQDGNIKDNSNSNFGVLTPTEEGLNRIYNPTLLSSSEKMRVEYQKDLAKYEEQIKKERESDPLYQQRKNQFTMIKNTVDDLRKNNYELTKGKSDSEVYNAFLQDREGRYKKSLDTSVPILNPVINEAVGVAVSNNINGTEFYLTDGSRVTRDWNDKKGIGSITNVPYETFQEMMVQGKLPLAYNITRGSHYIEIPIVDGDIKRTTSGEIDWTETKTKGKKTVYFSPDKQLAGVAKLIPQLDAMIKDKNTQDMIPDDFAMFGIEGFDKSKIDYRKDVNTQEVFKMRRERGENESDEEYQKNPYEWYSLDEIRDHMKSFVDTYMSATYGSFKQ